MSRNIEKSYNVSDSHDKIYDVHCETAKQIITLASAYKECFDTKIFSRCKRELVVTELAASGISGLMFHDKTRTNYLLMSRNYAIKTMQYFNNKYNQNYVNVLEKFVHELVLQ